MWDDKIDDNYEQRDTIMARRNDLGKDGWMDGRKDTQGYHHLMNTYFYLQ